MEHGSFRIRPNKRRWEVSTSCIDLLLKESQVEREEGADSTTMAVKETKKVESKCIHDENLSRFQSNIELELRVVKSSDVALYSVCVCVTRLVGFSKALICTFSTERGEWC